MGGSEQLLDGGSTGTDEGLGGIPAVEDGGLRRAAAGRAAADGSALPRVQSPRGEHRTVVLLPAQRAFVQGPEQQTLLVPGSSDALREAVDRAHLAGWDTWAVRRHGGTGDWRVTLARRDEGDGCGTR